MTEEAKTSAAPQWFGPFFVGTYAWMVTVFLGMILVDAVVASAAADLGSAVGIVSDFLLEIGMIVLTSAVFALFFSWNKASRNVLIASVVLLLLEFAIPIVFSNLVQNAAGAGAALRLVPATASSILALIALRRFDR